MKMFTIDVSQSKAHRRMLEAELTAARPREAICHMASPDSYTVYRFELSVDGCNIWDVTHKSPGALFYGTIRKRQKVTTFKKPAGCTDFTDQCICKWLEYRGGKDYSIGRDI